MEACFLSFYLSRKLVEMRLLMLGHSYVRDLKRFSDWHRDLHLELDNGFNIPIDVRFQAYPGKDYSHFLNNLELFELVREVKPEVVVIILGGNSIVNNVTNCEINTKAKEFYVHLNNVLPSGCLRLATQIEPRFPFEGNRFGAPTAIEYGRRRNVINNYINKQIKKSGAVDGVIMLGGESYLNNEASFSDGVHLKPVGLEKYKDAVLGGIKFALNKRL